MWILKFFVVVEVQVNSSVLQLSAASRYMWYPVLVPHIVLAELDPFDSAVN